MIPLFVELCAGTAALSLRLHGGPRARPPVSRMGNKQGYAAAILRTLGLRSGSGAARYLWCEPDPGCRLLLTSYTDPELRAAAAEIIRGWADEEPRALWERLRAEGPVQAPPVDPREVARWTLTAAWGATGVALGEKRVGFMGPRPELNNGQGKSITIPSVAAHLAAHSSLPATILPDAREVQPATLPPGTVAYIDPPYANTTGYGHDLGRAEVCALAERWASAGAWVVISEAEPLTELGWPSVEITGERVGQKRTFSRQQREFLTMSKPPRWRPSVQSSLFGGEE
jgi:hypothetical protein